jgi:hypothetical protein
LGIQPALHYYYFESAGLRENPVDSGRQRGQKRCKFARNSML